MTIIFGHAIKVRGLITENNKAVVQMLLEMARKEEQTIEFVVN